MKGRLPELFRTMNANGHEVGSDKQQHRRTSRHDADQRMTELHASCKRSEKRGQQQHDPYRYKPGKEHNQLILLRTDLQHDGIHEGC